MKWHAFTYALVVFHSTNDGQLQLKTIDELLLYGTSIYYVSCWRCQTIFSKNKMQLYLICFRVSEAVSSYNHVDLGCSCLLSLLPTEFVYCQPVMYSIISYGNFRVYRPYSVVSTNISLLSLLKLPSDMTSVSLFPNSRFSIHH